MKIINILHIVFIYLTLTLPALADGYPFDADTQEVEGNLLKIEINKSQITKISSTGTIILTNEQLALIQKFYPSTSAKQRIVAATFNDSIEGLGPNDVYCFWIRANCIAITLNSSVIDNPDESKKSLIQPAEEPIPTSNLLRMSPEGLIFHLGKEITLEEAFNLINTFKKKTETEYGLINIVIPPPFVPSRINEESYNLNTKVAKLVSTLELYAKEQGVQMNKTW